MNWKMDPIEFKKFRDEMELSLPIEKLQEAMTHPSIKEYLPDIKSNEQLETLGDAVLDLLVCRVLIENDDRIESGKLTQLRSSLVSNRILAKLGEKLQLDELLQITEGYNKNYRDIANAVEALFGAIFLVGGYSEVEKFFLKIYPDLEIIAKENGFGKFQYYNPIGELQEFTQKNRFQLPEYQIVEQKGPDHNPEFKVKGTVKLSNKVITGTGIAGSKKRAREYAAKAILENLSDLNISDNLIQ